MYIRTHICTVMLSISRWENWFGKNSRPALEYYIPKLETTDSASHLNLNYMFKKVREKDKMS
jgi:hypothetical protein